MQSLSQERLIQAAIVRADILIVAACNAVKRVFPALAVAGIIVICAIRLRRGR